MTVRYSACNHRREGHRPRFSTRGVLGCRQVPVWRLELRDRAWSLSVGENSTQYIDMLGYQVAGQRTPVASAAPIQGQVKGIRSPEAKVRFVCIFE